jgi:hypothetical protein
VLGYRAKILMKAVPERGVGRQSIRATLDEIIRYSGSILRNPKVSAFRIYSAYNQRGCCPNSKEWHLRRRLLRYWLKYHYSVLQFCSKWIGRSSHLTVLAQLLHKSKPMPRGLSRMSLDLSYSFFKISIVSVLGVYRIRMDIKMRYSKDRLSVRSSG